MVATPLFFAAGSIFALSRAAPLNTFARSLVARADVAYKIYGGDGTVAQGWPAVSDWVDYDKMWDANSQNMKTCLNNLPPNSDAEINAIKNGIEEAAKGSGLDHRFLLAVIMQESGGCVRVNTTYSPGDNIRNPGLMQDFNGKYTCNDPQKGTPLKNPCPDTDIIGMITDGAGVTNDGGLKQAVAGSKASDDSKYYKAARIYNSGSIDASGNLGKGVATHCYASDIANRLMGWLGEPKVCKEEEIGNVQGSASTNTSTTPASDVPSPSTTPSTAKPTPVPSSNATSINPVPSGTSVSTSATGTPTGSQSGAVASKPEGPVGEGASKDCKAWYTVKSGDNCQTIESFYGLPAGTLKKLNTGLNDQCTNLELGSSYCVRNV